MRETRAPSWQRILIVRLSSIGDVIHGLPVLCALRAQRPDAFIAWLVEEWAAELLRDHPALDEVIVVPRNSLHHGKSPWTDVAGHLWRLHRILRARRFDAAIDLQGLTRSALAAWISGARVRVGFEGVDGRQRSRLFNNRRVEPARAHVVERNLDLLSPLGIAPGAVEFRLPAEAPDVVRGLEPILGRSPFSLLGVGTSRVDKQWPVDRYADLARRLHEQHGLRSFLLWGWTEEKAVAEAIAQRSLGTALALPALTLREVAALGRRAALFVGPDSAALHLATAVGTASVGLYGPTDPARNGPYGVHARAVASTDGTMAGLSTDDVTAACAAVLRLAVGPPPEPGAGSRS